MNKYPQKAIQKAANMYANRCTKLGDDFDRVYSGIQIMFPSADPIVAMEYANKLKTKRR